ncbi:P-loop NTPase fold protein [Shewanella hanedai]|nr:P-loop NTPase fold protein [Shewanella hanedai]
MTNSSTDERQYQEPTKLRYYQQDAVNAIAAAMQSKEDVSILVMPTGTGKTSIIVEAISNVELIETTTVMATLTILRAQLQSAFHSASIPMSKWDVANPQKFIDNPTAYSVSNLYILYETDAKTIKELLPKIKKASPSAKILIISSYMSPEQIETVGGNVIYSYLFQEAIKDGYLNPVRVIQDKNFKADEAFTDSSIESFISSWLSNVALSPEEKVIISCSNIYEAGRFTQILEQILATMPNVAIHTTLITSETNNKQELIEQFRLDETAHIAITVDLLITDSLAFPNLTHILNFKLSSPRRAHTLIALISRPKPNGDIATIWDYSGFDWSIPGLGIDIENSQLSVTNKAYRIEPKGDQENRTDLLGRGTLVHVLKGIIESDSKFKPFTVGLFGKWGTGKSTIINLLKQGFKANPDYRFSIFNAWENEHCDFMAGALANHLATDLYSKKSLLKRTYMLGKYKVFLQKNALKNTLIWWGGIGITALAVIATGIVDSFLPQDIKSQIIASGLASGFALTIFGIAKNIWASPFLKKIKSISHSPDYSKHLGVAQYLKEDMQALMNSYSFSAIQYVKTRFTSLFNTSKASSHEEEPNTGRKIILVIEDLDRCSPERIVNTLEAIRLLASLDNVIVVFAVDGEQLLNAVALKSLNSFTDQKQSQQIARDFLGKLFQLVIELDEPNPAQLSQFIQKRLYDSIAVETEITDSFKRSEQLKQQAKESVKDFKVDWEEAESEEEQITETSDSYLKSTIAEVEYFTLLTGLFNIGNPRTLIRLHNSITLLKGLFPVLISNDEMLKEYMFYLFLNEIYTVSIPTHAFDIPKFFEELTDTRSSRDSVVQYHYQQDIECHDLNALQVTLNRVRKVSIPHVKVLGKA